MIVKPVKWLKEPDENGKGLLEAEALGGEMSIPLPIETLGVAKEDVTLGKEQEFNFVFEGGSAPEFYEDEADYYKKRGSSMAAESLIPCGLFPATGTEESFVQSGRAIISGKITMTYEHPEDYGFSEGDILYTMNCLGLVIDVVIPDGRCLGTSFKAGSIAKDVYWVCGWPK